MRFCGSSECCMRLACRVIGFPLRRFESRNNCLSTVAVAQAASHEVLRLFRVLYAPGLQGYRVSRIRLILDVSTGKNGLFQTPSAVAFAAASSSHELTVSSECVVPRPLCLSAQGSFLGVLLPLRGMSEKRHRHGLPTPQLFRPWRFSRLRRLNPLLVAWICFTPQPRPGFPFRV